VDFILQCTLPSLTRWTRPRTFRCLAPSNSHSKPGSAAIAKKRCVCLYCWVKPASGSAEIVELLIICVLLQINTHRVAVPCVFHQVHAQPLNCGCFGSAPQTPYYWFDLAVFPAYSFLAFKNGVSCLC